MLVGIVGINRIQGMVEPYRLFVVPFGVISPSNRLLLNRSFLSVTKVHPASPVYHRFRFKVKLKDKICQFNQLK